MIRRITGTKAIDSSATTISGLFPGVSKNGSVTEVTVGGLVNLVFWSITGGVLFLMAERALVGAARDAGGAAAGRAGADAGSAVAGGGTPVAEPNENPRDGLARPGASAAARSTTRGYRPVSAARRGSSRPGGSVRTRRRRSTERRTDPRALLAVETGVLRRAA
ncbi:hypothetical protein G443_000140 [Actinoalloteichus cyanogriseus DSM 43889]|uniref:Uncharacterized protein n=2 Tax=Actinoalloteichus cyanogriseus TaxID=2893586 RepID=A0ABT1JBJ7_ACTCY|nr:hypothetical protein [Actinoalloteichus caeruleus DSM 43889]